MTAGSYESERLTRHRPGPGPIQQAALVSDRRDGVEGGGLRPLCKLARARAVPCVFGHRGRPALTGRGPGTSLVAISCPAIGAATAGLSVCPAGLPALLSSQAGAVVRERCSRSRNGGSRCQEAARTLAGDQ